MNWLTTYLAAHWLEIVGVVTAIVSIWLTVKRKMACWPIGLISDLAYLVIALQSRLYSLALLLVGGLPLVFYGWWYWERDVKSEGEVRVVHLPLPSLLAAVIAGAGGGLALGFWMKHIHAALPWLDAMLTSYSIVGGWWQARKHIANWWLWIVVDVIYVGEFLYQNLKLTAVLYAGFVVLAVLGLRDWRRAEAQSAVS